MNRKQLSLLSLIILLITTYLLAGGEQLLDVQRYQTLYRQSPESTTVIFFLSFLLGTTLSLPVTGTMAVVSGFLFGHVIGITLTLLACTCGGTLACFSSRYILHDLVQRRFGTQLATIKSSVEKDGMFYVCSLRMIPVIPFWLLNLLIGLTTMRLAQFFVSTLIGMVPIIMILVHIGTQLGAIQNFTLTEIFSPGLVFSLLLLATLPFIMRWSVNLIVNYRNR